MIELRKRISAVVDAATSLRSATYRRMQTILSDEPYDIQLEQALLATEKESLDRYVSFLEDVVSAARSAGLTDRLIRALEVLDEAGT